MQQAKRIPLAEGVRLYWLHLVPITALPSFILCIVGLLPNLLTALAILPLFFWAGHYAGIPFFKKNVTYAFWILACGMWMAGWIPAVAIFAGLKALLA